MGDAYGGVVMVSSFNFEQVKRDIINKYVGGEHVMG
jgi:hypothetical protein